LGQGLGQLGSAWLTAGVLGGGQQCGTGARAVGKPMANGREGCHAGCPHRSRAATLGLVVP
jgi:hypothetical protein